MTFDAVHDTQAAFRILTKCSAFPGTLGDLSLLASKIDLDLPYSQGVALICLTLLDGEVSFYSSSDEISRSISQLTYSRASSLAKADYVMASEPDELMAAHRGSLIDPHQGATVILTVDSMTEGENLELSGPGIETTSAVAVSAGFDWIAPREEANKEFPLGIDLYLLDKRNRLMILPRTTKIRRIS